MQTAKGGEAKRVTTQEFQEVVLPALMEELKAENKAHPGYYGPVICISWDKAKWHVAGPALKLRGTRFQFLPVPTQGHDFNRVVEHAINTLKRAARKYFRDHPEVTKIAEMKAAVYKLFKQVVTADSVRKDIQGLHAMYHVINASNAKGGTEGGWPPKKYRCDMVVHGA